MDLEVIVQQFQKKDTAAFEKLYQMYSGNICGVINTIVKDTDVAEEICQVVFMEVWNNSELYNVSKGRFFTWILNIARNAAIDKIRSKSHKTSKVNLSADYFVGMLESKEDNESGKEDTMGFKKLLVNLKEKCVEIIELLYFKGLTQKEVSIELDIPLGTVKTWNRSCISQIRTNVTL